MAFSNGLGESLAVTRIKQTIGINNRKIADLRAQRGSLLNQKRSYEEQLARAQERIAREAQAPGGSFFGI